MNVAVLGGAGFIGQHVVKTFVGRGDAVYVWDKEFGIEVPGAAAVYSGSNYDLTDESVWNNLLYDRIDVIVNCIANLATRDTVVIVMRMVDALLHGLRQGWSPHVIHLSSAAVYGDGWKSEHFPLKEGASSALIMGDLSLYGLDKFVGERYLGYASAFGAAVTIIRPANVYGPGQHGNVVDQFMRRLKVGEAPVINRSASVTRDFVHVDDLVSSIIAAVELPAKIGVSRVYNVGTGIETTMGQLADMLRGLIGGPHWAVNLDGDCGIRRSALDYRRIERELGWTPVTTLEAGLASLCQETPEEKAHRELVQELRNSPKGKLLGFVE